MWNNADMRTARREKKDEFYTRLEDIEAEMAYYVAHDPDVFQDAVVLLPCDDPEESNFVRYFRERFSDLGLKRLIATSYNPEGRGKCLIAEAGDGGSPQERRWLLEGNGDFRSEEVTALRDDADFVVTNPPFSLFQAFILWALDGGVRLSVMGNLLGASYRGVFPYVKAGALWYGPSVHSGALEFKVPEHYPLNGTECRIDDLGDRYVKVKGVRWFSNIEPAHYVKAPLRLNTMEHNMEHNSRVYNNPRAYVKYDNYDAIEVPTTSGIPSDYDGAMGVPVTFLDKYAPDQFEILGVSLKGMSGVPAEPGGAQPLIDGKALFRRIFVRHRR